MTNPLISSVGPVSRHGPRSPDPDAHGQAALLLAASMPHALLEAKLLTRGQVVDAVRTAAGVKVEMAEEEQESAATMRRSLFLLEWIEHSFTTVDRDLPWPGRAEFSIRFTSPPMTLLHVNDRGGG